MSSSSCDAIVLDTFGRQGIGVTQPQSGTDFPLVGPPSTDIRYLLADANLSYDDPYDYNVTTTPLALPFRIWWLYGVGCEPVDAAPYTPTPTHSADILIVDANMCIVFDSTQATEFVSRAWGTRLHVYTWETEDAVCSIIVHTAWAATAANAPEPSNYDVHIYPEGAILDERTVERRPKRVKSLRVVFDSYTQAGIDLVEGYNMQLRSIDSSVRNNRNVQRMEMRATAGGGIGNYPDCLPEFTVLRKINNIRPTTAGDFFLAANQCYYVRQPAALSGGQSIPVPAMLKVGNDCEPCCDCNDYVDLANYMNDTRNKYYSVGQQAEAVRDLHHSNYERWCAAKRCFDSQPIRLVVQPQLCPFLDIAAQFVNLSDQCVGPLQLNIAFTNTAIAGDEVAGFTQIRGQTYKRPRRVSKIERYNLGGSWPNFTAQWDSVEPGQSAWVRFRIKFDACGLDNANNPLNPRVCVTGTINGEPISIPAPLAVNADVCNSPGTVVASVCENALLRCPATVADVNDYADCIRELL